MPFIIRKIEPRYIGRGHVPQDTTCAEIWPVGAELGAITNGVLACTLKQLASLLANAEDIFSGLTTQLTDVANRSGNLRRRIDQLDDRLASIDPKKIPVPESDISTFATRTQHYHASSTPTTGLFVPITRPKALKELYDAAAVIAVKSLDSLRRERDAASAVDMYLCTPILGKRRRDQSLDIESRVPAFLDEMRRWTSTEALGDVTAPPDCLSRILQGGNVSDDGVDHKLPSPEERVQTIALKFPAEIVAVDVSGRGFARMSMRRRSLGTCQSSNQSKSDSHEASGVVKRRSRVRKSRGKRRNTIAGTDGNEIKKAITDQSTTADQATNLNRQSANISGRAYRSASTDILEYKKDLPVEIKWNFDTLKAWGKSRLKRMNPKSEVNNRPSESSSCNSQIYTLRNGYEKKKDEMHERKPSLSSLSSKSVASSIILSSHTHQSNPPIRQSGVRLRESAAQRRERRKGNNNRDDPPHSSSGNWSASSESGRASIGSESTTMTNPPSRSTTAITATGTLPAAKILLQCQAKRFKARDTSTSSSVTSEGTLTPDIIQDIGVISFSDEIEGEGETCSIYSCDTEGYYTSFHMDSGLKTLREEETQTAISSSRHNSLGKLNVATASSPMAENEYELFGRGSTSTTTSSAGTVCTALMAPVPPERKSSLTVVAMVHGQNSNGDESPDSGHNTSSSPVESASSPACYTARSCSELEYSESSDLEGFDRIERIRSKTAISTSRIPSMCVITPPGSDDEQQSQSNVARNDISSQILMSATVGTSKMEVINGQDKNLYATVQTVEPRAPTLHDTLAVVRSSPLSGMLDKIRCVLPISGGRKHAQKNANAQFSVDSGDYVTIADVRNNNKCQTDESDIITYANAQLLAHPDPRDSADYVSLSELPKKSDSSLERKRQGARVTLDSEGKVIYSSDSLKRRKGSHTTFNPGPFVRDTLASSPVSVRSPKSPHRRVKICAVARKTTVDQVDGKIESPEQQENIDRPLQRPVRGAYVNIQSKEDNSLVALSSDAAPVRAQMTQKISSLLEENSQLLSAYQREEYSSPRREHGKFYTMPYGKNQPNYSTDNSNTENNKINDFEQQFDSTNDNARQILTSNFKNRFYTPLQIPALGYRFFASTPVNTQKENKCRENEALNHSPIVPINEYTPDFSEILAPNINAGIQPKNLKKCKMSNDELFTAIYKSKRKLNIQAMEIPPDNSLSQIKSLCLDRPGTRHSWSPESHSTAREPTPAATTTRLDFKRLLLQHSTKMGLNKISAAEQLKISRQQVQQRGQKQLAVQQNWTPPSTIARALSPRSTWRFQTPRSDVLSSTIIEDTAAEESAMSSRPFTRRQLDISHVFPRDTHHQSRAHLPSRNTMDRYNFRVRPASPLNQLSMVNVKTPSPTAPTLETAL